MSILVSCWHCKRPVLTVPRMTDGELLSLSEHLAVCDHPDGPSLDDPSVRLDADHVLRHFRAVEIDDRARTNRTARAGARHAP